VQKRISQEQQRDQLRKVLDEVIEAQRLEYFRQWTGEDPDRDLRSRARVLDDVRGALAARLNNWQAETQTDG
jgi:hypothetical protein